MQIPGYTGAQPQRGLGARGFYHGGGMPPPQGAMPYQTPVANQVVEGINQFVDNFKGVRDEEKQAAKQRFLEAVQMAQLGLPIDMQKAARDARKAGLNFDYDSPRQPQQPQGQPGAMPPPGQPGMGAPPMGQQPQGNPLQRMGRWIQNTLVPPPTPDVPMDAPIMQALQQMQGGAQQKLQMEQMRDRAMAGVMTKPVGSPEWNEDVAKISMLQKMQDNGDIGDLPEHQIFRAARMFKITEQEARDRLFPMKVALDPKERVKLATPFILKGIPAEEALTAVDAILAGDTDVDLRLPDDSEKETAQEKKKRIDYWRARFPGAATQQLEFAALYDVTENYGALDALIDKMGPSVEKAAEDRAESAEARAARSEGRQIRAEGRAETEEGRKQDKDWVSYTASSILSEMQGDPKRAIDALNKIAKGSTKIRANLIPLEKAIKALEGPKVEVNVNTMGSSDNINE